MTPTQQIIYDFIHNYLQQNGRAPTIREISQVVYRVPSVVQGTLKILRKKGFVDWIDGKTRTLRLLDMVGTYELVSVQKRKKDVPTVITVWGRRYVYEPNSKG